MSRERGSIICVSSRLGMVSMAGQVLYSAAKGGLIMFARAAAIELAPQGIRVNVSCPGAHAHPENHRIVCETARPRKLHCPARLDDPTLGRLAQPRGVADPIYFLASPPRLM